ncbi:MAG: prolipoprotein diacylglyceryl transferase [Anaerolineales bacterium]|nr:prolipoprotein diacylglyceryl transferase [Anaerolineales bacterium]
MPTGFQLGPFTVHYYGLVILLGTFIALFLISREAGRKGKTLDFLIDAIPWILVGSVFGARIWHIFTPPESMVAHGITTRYYLTHLLEALAIWKGGIGIIGAVLGGTLALWLFARKKGVPAADWMDIIAPGVALAQAFGRWGNFINQEVYGLPTSLPWAITIDPQHRLPGYAQFSTYHPLFIYESLWSLINMILLLWVGRKYQERLKPGSLFLVYLIIYSVGRIGLEFLRLDISSFQGININQTAMIVVGFTASLLFIIRQKSISGALDQE